MMISKEVSEIISHIKKDKAVGTVTISILLLTFTICFLLSPLSALIILSSYILGLASCGFLIKYQMKTSFCFKQLVKTYKSHFCSTESIKELPCSVCNGPNCSRHQHNAKAPWKGFLIDKKLNDSIEEFFNHIINEFVELWYENLTNDKTFVYELKYSLRYALASFVRRFLKLDFGRIIANRLIPCGIKHIDDYLCMLQIAELRNSNLNKIAVDFLGRRLHIAASSRSNEIKYLQALSTALTERLLPADNLKCKNFNILLREILAGWVLLPLMDVMADPNVINSLLILITTYRSRKHHQNIEGLQKVEFLINYRQMGQEKLALSMDLQSLMMEPKNFYFLMQFLKKEGCLHLLNFYLDIEAFNTKLLKPDLSKKQLEDLHSEALNLYKDYLEPNSDNFIGCSLDIVQELKSLLDAGVYEVAKLQTAEPLFKASEFAFNVIENEWLPFFFHSSEFYMMICGTKNVNNQSKSSATSAFILQESPTRFRHQKRIAEGPSAVTKISNSFGKIKGALQPKQPVEGGILQSGCDSWIPESDAAYTETLPDTSSNIRDLSTWQIHIPAVETHQCDSKPVCVFNIDVQTRYRGESGRKQWVIKRRDQDFYTLKAKLIEFHGEGEISSLPLPSRRSALSIDLRKQNYEDFLKRLLEKPVLKGSDLLYTFLTAQQNFTMLVTAPMPFVDLENIYQSVAYKLRKEKGQHLDSFMSTFLNSTGRTKPPKFEWAEMGDEIDFSLVNKAIPKTAQNRIFGNNFNVPYKREAAGSSSSVNPNGITESALYLRKTVKYIFKVPTPILKLYVAICSVAQQAIESMCRTVLERKIKSALPPSTIAFLIKQVEVLIFSERTSPTAEELEQRKLRAFKEIHEIIPNFLSILLGKDAGNGLCTILTILQNPLCNKQLAYNLVDIVLTEMFPELDSSDEFQ